MRILMIRHGDPDYERDGLTEKGKREAMLLADRLAVEPISEVYVSPLGRARETASYTLEKLGCTAQEKDWLQEFPAKVDINDSPLLQRAFPDAHQEKGRFSPHITWDILPEFWREVPEYYGREEWRRSPVSIHSDINEVYDRVAAGLDEVLAKHGYVREGSRYRTKQGNQDTVAFFCHFGVTCVLLAHLWGASPYVLWHGMAMAPSSVTEVYTEERAKGEVLFRATKIGDISHLYAAGEAPSFSARFCEVYENEWERH